LRFREVDEMGGRFWLFISVSVGLAACGTSDGPGGSPSGDGTKDCAFDYTRGTQALLDQEAALGNSCQYEITAGAQPPITGTCNAVRRVTSSPLPVPQSQVEFTDDRPASAASPYSRLTVELIVSKASWTSLVPFSYVSGSASNPKFARGELRIKLGYIRAAQYGATSTSPWEMDPMFTDLDCSVEGSGEGSETKRLTALELHLTSVNQVCTTGLAGALAYFVGHGSLDATCDGHGPMFVPTPVKIHFAF
jgi:hypothetical protein